jgi:diguanylate cyclase (GGDEF)-like protein/PAS domain S-box-containing protein
LDKYRTIFPPLLIALPRHLQFVRDFARSLATRSEVERLDTSYWEWHRSGAGGLPTGLSDTELRAAWDELGNLHEALLRDAEAGKAAAARGEDDQAHAALDRVLAGSARLAELVVGASLRELGNAFDQRERLLIERYEREFLEAAQIGRFSVRLSDQTFLSADEACAQMLGRSPRALAGTNARTVLGAVPFDELVAVTAEGRTARVLARGADKEAPTLELVAYREPRSRGTLHGFAVNVTAAERDAQQRKLLYAAIDCSDQVVVITDARQEIVYVNPAFTRVTGYSREEALGRNPRFLQGAETSQATRVALRESVAAGQRAHAEILNYTKHGDPYWIEISLVPVQDENAVITHWVAIERDVSARKAQEQEITRLAMEDHLTGLLNRRAAEARLAVEWGRARRDSNPFAIALVDVDRFKLVNDQYGHQTGDAVLCHVAATLNGNLRGGDWLARWGGEEFLMVLHGLDAAGALTAGERVRRLLKSKPVSIATGELPVTVSIGIALYSPEANNIDEIVAQADALLYEAKQSGRDRVLVTGNRAGRRGGLIWEGSQVQSALHEGRVLPVFQPIVDLRTGGIVGEEALARIRTREDALVEAKRFIQAAEALHLVRYIDRTVTTVALERTAEAVERGRPLGAYFINLAAQSIADAELVGTLREQALAFRMLRGGRNPMVIEITERQTAGMDTLKAHLEPLLDAGFRLALDDFGSGYSSFSYLAELPVDFLKIEGWMVQGLTHSPRIRRLVETIVATAKSFGVMTVAECVEDAEAAQLLCDVGVDLAQGFYFGRPALVGAA